MVNVIHEIIDLSLAAQQAYLAINTDMAQVAMARAQFPTTPDPESTVAAATAG
jgi:hypothetical protein